MSNKVSTIPSDASAILDFISVETTHDGLIALEQPKTFGEDENDLIMLSRKQAEQLLLVLDVLLSDAR